MRRSLGTAIFAATLLCSFLGPAYAGTDNGKGNGGENNGNQNGKSWSVPELNPTELGSAVALLCGGLVLMSERRRKKS
jgi:hypothetical protein